MESSKTNNALVKGLVGQDNLLHLLCGLNFEKPDVLKLLLSNCTLIDEPSVECKTPLMLCAERGHLESLKVLIQCKTDSWTFMLSPVKKASNSSMFGSGPSWNDEAILIAADKKHEHCVLELLDAGVDVWSMCSEQSLLQVAAEKDLSMVVLKCLAIGKVHIAG